MKKTVDIYREKDDVLMKVYGKSFKQLSFAAPKCCVSIPQFTNLNIRQ
jgi:hypothetical protein